MRKSTVRNGLRLICISLMLILAVSFYHAGIASIASLSLEAESRLYRYGIFWGTALGAYGVLLSTFGCVLVSKKQDVAVRIFPWFMMIVAMVSLFFYLLSSSFDAPSVPGRERLRPGETITI